MNIILIRSNPVNPDPPVEKVFKKLHDDGNKVKLICWNRDNNKNKIITIENRTIGGINTEVYSINIPSSYGRGAGNIFSILKFQIILMYVICKINSFHAIHSFDFDTGLATCIFAKIFKKKFVYHILDYYADSHVNIKDKLLYSIIRFLENKVISCADVTIICSEKRREQIKDAKARKVEVIYNSPCDNFSSEKFPLQSKNKKIRISYVGIFSNGRLLKEMLEFVSKHDQIELHIAGFGCLENEVFEAAKKYSNIFYYGKIQYYQTLQLESQCHIMTAIYDPDIINHKYASPNKFFEALLLGKPIIMAKNTGFADVVEKNNLGSVIDFSYSGFEKGINDLISRNKEWPAIKEREYKIYKEKYSWEKMETKIRNIYKELQ